MIDMHRTEKKWTKHSAGTKVITVGPVKIGGDQPVVVQSMTNTDTRDISATMAQIEELARAGCELIRVAVPDREAAAALKEICARSPVPVIADIHFDYRLALEAVASGAAKLRLNPGNISKSDHLRQVIGAAKERGIPIRVGVNSGSVPPKWREKYPDDLAAAMVAAAGEYTARLEDMDFTDIVLSLKASDVPTTVRANRLARERFPYPLHLGVTEAGTPWRGTIKSAAGIGSLLLAGIGDTIRVSLAGDPGEEVRVAYAILSACGLRQRGPEVIACPTCGRTEIDVVGLAEEVERRVSHLTAPVKVAVMGCIVNGPGEASHADVGIAGGKGRAMLFRKGQAVRRLEEEEIVDVLVEEVERIAAQEGC